MHDGAGAEAEQKHQAGGVNEQQQAVLGVAHDATGDLADPAIGAQLDVADHGVNEQEREQDRRGELRQHFAEADPGLARLGARKGLAKHQDAVDQDRQQKHRHLDYPVHLMREGSPLADAAAVHQVRDKAAGDEAARPAGMQDIQIMGLLAREEGRDHRIDDDFAGAVADGEQEHGDVQVPVARLSAERGVDLAGRQLEQRGEDVHQEREGHELAVADAIGDERAENDDDAEASQAAADDFAQLGHSEAEFVGPVDQDAAAHREADARGEDRKEACPEQALGIGSGAVVHEGPERPRGCQVEVISRRELRPENR
jgi:hypothetical protein